MDNNNHRRHSPSPRAGPQQPPVSSSRLNLGRSGPRSRNGCWTCRAKKVKCDEARPVCLRCVRLVLVCDYEPRHKPIGNYGWVATESPWDSQTTTSPEQHAEGPGEVLQATGTDKGDSGVRVSARTHCVGQRSPRGTRLCYNETSRYAVLPGFQLAAPNTAANSVELTLEDHEAIRCYQTSPYRLYQTKTPKYALYTVMLTVAERSPIVMHMILALGGSEIDFKRGIGHGRNEESLGSSKRVSGLKSRALHHYSVALRLMADMVGQGAEGGQLDLDCVLTALYYMLTYEQIFGSAQGLANHLAGAAIIVRHHCAHLVRLKLLTSATQGNATSDEGQQQLAFSRTSQPGSDTRISQYSARLVSRLALTDAIATSYGIGGDVISTLCKVRGIPDRDAPSFNPLDLFDSLEQYTLTLYRNVWGESYPTTEMADDVENRPVYALFGACVQLRYMINQLPSLNHTSIPDGEHAATSAQQQEDQRRQLAIAFSQMQDAIERTAARFSDLLALASTLALNTPTSGRRLITNVRFVVPYYHAIILEFHRLIAITQQEQQPQYTPDPRRPPVPQLTPHPNRDRETEPERTPEPKPGPGPEPAPGLTLTPAQHTALRGIIALAVQAFRTEGDTAMMRITHPLFLAALETDDVLHREWVLERFKGLGKTFGPRFERARGFLEKVIAAQERVGRRVDVRGLVRSGFEGVEGGRGWGEGVGAGVFVF